MGVGRARWGVGRERTNIERELRGQQQAVGAEKEASYSLGLPHPAHPSRLSYVNSLSLEEGVPDRAGRPTACSPLRCQGVGQPGLSSGGRHSPDSPLYTSVFQEGAMLGAVLSDSTAPLSPPHPHPRSCSWPRTLVSSLPCRPASPLSSPLGPRLCPHWFLLPGH